MACGMKSGPVASAPRPYGVRVTSTGTRSAEEGRQTVAIRTTPSRIGTGTAESTTTALGTGGRGAQPARKTSAP